MHEIKTAQKVHTGVTLANTSAATAAAAAAVAAPAAVLAAVDVAAAAERVVTHQDIDGQLALRSLLII